MPCGFLSSFGLDPLTLSPAVWLDASDASTLYDATSGGSLVSAEGLVARWQDKSGNGRHATQSDSAQRGTRKASYRGSLDAVDFPAMGRMLIPHTLNRPYTIVLAARQKIPTGNRRLVASQNANCVLSINRVSFCVFTNALIRSAAIRGGASEVGEAVVSLVVSDSAATTLHANGGSNIADANPASQNWGLLSLGGGGEGIEGFFFEFFAFDRALSSGDRAALESYLLAKWSIS